LNRVSGLSHCAGLSPRLLHDEVKFDLKRLNWVGFKRSPRESYGEVSYGHLPTAQLTPHLPSATTVASATLPIGEG